jgi:tripartite-type tricarboxylate transporter receptor subunit TctC
LKNILIGPGIKAKKEKQSMRVRFTSVLLLGILVGLTPAFADSWPTKPLRIFNGYSPGGSVDLTCRAALGALQPILGQPALTENKPGNAGIVAAVTAAHSAPDGYNYFCAAASSIVTNPLTFKDLPYNPASDFVPVGMIGTNPFFIMVNPKVKANTLQELIALDKAKPGSMVFVSDGTKNFSGLVGSWLNKLAGTKFVQVPYSTMTQGLEDTVAGRTQIIMQPPATARQFIESGQLRPLAVTSLKPAEGFESVPPVANILPGFEFVGWVGVFAPKGTPPEAIKNLNHALNQAIKDPVVIQRLKALGMTAAKPGTPEQMADFVTKENVRWTHLIKAIGFQPD